MSIRSICCRKKTIFIKLLRYSHAHGPFDLGLWFMTIFAKIIVFCRTYTINYILKYMRLEVCFGRPLKTTNAVIMGLLEYE